MLTKLLGSLLIITATTGYGYYKGLSYKRHVEELERLKKIIWLFKGEMRYTKANLPEVCRKLSRKVEEPYASWFLGLAVKQEQHTWNHLGMLWETETREKLASLCLTEDEMEELAKLGYQFGYLDVEMQEKILIWYGEQLEEKRRNLAEKMEEQRRLSQTLGIMAGIFLVILLV